MNFNRRRYVNGNITDDHFDTLVRIAQRVLRHPDGSPLTVDGQCGPRTIAALEARITADAAPDFSAVAPLAINSTGCLVGPGVMTMLSHRSWTHQLANNRPLAIVAHYTATEGGEVAMARRRLAPLDRDGADNIPGNEDDDRVASWHVTIGRRGNIVQMIPFDRGGYHARGRIPALGPANRHSIGIELVGHGDSFTPAQVVAAGRVWRALARTYGIRRGLAMVEHSELDPKRRRDPGPLWMSRYASAVLDYAYDAPKQSD